MAQPNIHSGGHDAKRILQNHQIRRFGLKVENDRHRSIVRHSVHNNDLSRTLTAEWFATTTNGDMLRLFLLHCAWARLRKLPALAGFAQRSSGNRPQGWFAVFDPARRLRGKLHFHSSTGVRSLGKLLEERNGAVACRNSTSSPPLAAGTPVTRA